MMDAGEACEYLDSDFKWPQYRHAGDVGLAEGGMTKREEYASRNLATIIGSDLFRDCSMNQCVDEAIQYADILIERLSK